MQRRWSSFASNTGWNPWTAALALCLGALALYLLSPALTATHVEGYTAALQLNAIAADRHLIDRADLLYPVQTEYLHLTRQGVELLLRAAMRLSGDTGDAMFRGLTLGSLAVFLGATALVARRHGGVSWWATVCSLMLLPGLFELGFYFNDGVVAAAFGTAGFALLPPRRDGRATAASALRAAAAGAALAMAALCRADALLMVPLAVGLVWLDAPPPCERTGLQLAALLAGMLSVFAAAQAVSGTTFVQALDIGRFFDVLHQAARLAFVRAGVLVLFFGVPGLAFVALGVRLLLRRERPRQRLVLLGLPGVVLILALRSATETRQIYPFIAPFAVIACARGLEWALRASTTTAAAPRARAGATALLVATAVVWVAPPVFVPVKDGPRAVLGRVWSPPMWRAWQARVGASLDDLDALVERAGTLPRLVVVSAHFNSDHFLQLRAWQRGWVPQRVAETTDRCPGGVETWRKGEHTLLQIRLDDPYGIGGVGGDDFAALRLRDALACPTLDGSPTVVADFFPPLSESAFNRVLREHVATEPPREVSFAWPASVADRIRAAWGGRQLVVPLSYGTARSAPVDPEQLRRVRALVAQRLADPTGHRGPPLPVHSDDLLARFRSRHWAPPVSPAPPAEPARP